MMWLQFERGGEWHKERPNMHTYCGIPPTAPVWDWSDEELGDEPICETCAMLSGE